MLVVNIGTQGITKVRYKGGNDPDKGFVVEHKHFPPDVPVECSEEMGKNLLAKYSNPTMAVYFKSHEDALVDASKPMNLTMPDDTSAEIEEEPKRRPLFKKKSSKTERKKRK